MGANNNFKPSSKKLKDQQWFWPSIYGAIAILMVVAIFSYTQLVNNDAQTPLPEDQVAGGNTDIGDGGSVIPVNQTLESMKYPLKEEKLSNAKVVQEFYDVNATPELQQNALLVFNQTFQTSEGVSISVNADPFEVLAAMSGEVKEVKFEPFIGNRVVIAHAGGYETIYQSVGDILVKEGDVVKQGDQIGTAIENESNPMAGVHLHFKVKKDGQLMNPRSLLAF